MALPNSPLEIVFSFDTTGSMWPCLDEVRGRVSDMVQRLQADIPNIRIAIFAHGDYFDTSYVTKHVDFTDDVAKLCDFVKTVGPTSGWDPDECYELVLYEARTQLSWTPGSRRALVMIGDSEPHGPNYPLNKLKLDWKQEVTLLADMGVRIYAVQCRDFVFADKFYKALASLSGGKHLKLSDFKNVFDFLMAVCYREKGAEFVNDYESEVRARGSIDKDLNDLFVGLRDEKGSDSKVPLTENKSSNAVKLSKSPIYHVKTITKTAILRKKPSVKKARRVLRSPTITKLVNPISKKAISTKKHQSKCATRTIKVPKAFLKYTDNNLPQLRRENVFENNFLLKDMNWSTWKLAISPSATEQTDKARTGNGGGFRARSIFGGKTQVAALYEVAVQTHSRCRKFVVFSKCCSRGFSNTGNWETKLLGSAGLRKQIDDVIKRNCRTFVRRCVLNKKHEHDSVWRSLRRYDYAWSRRPRRPVSKQGVDISGRMDVGA